MAPPAKKAKVDEKADEEMTEKKEEEVKKVEKEEPKEAETDARSVKAPITESVVFHTKDTTLNIMSSVRGDLLKPLSEGGCAGLLAGARANVGVKKGRYMYEVKVVEWAEGGGGGWGNKGAKCQAKIGFSTAGSDLLMGDNADSIFFDSDGGVTIEGKRIHCGKKWGMRDAILAVVLNLDSSSPNANTVSLFNHGQRISSPQALPESMKGLTLFPTVVVRSVTVHTNFGPEPLATMPFKCNMIGGAESKDVSIAEAEKKPKDAKYEVVFPVCLPGEASYTWLEMYLKKNPKYTELSERSVKAWCAKSGTSSDGVLKLLQAAAPANPRDFLVMELKTNLVAADRTKAAEQFPASIFKLVALPVIGEPDSAFEKHTRALRLKDKQKKSDVEFQAKKIEEKKQKLLEKKKKEGEKLKKIAETKRKNAVAEQKWKLAESARVAKVEMMKKLKKEVPEEMEKETPKPEPEPEVVEEDAVVVEEVEIEEDPPKASLTAEEKAQKFYCPVPDMDAKSLALFFTKFSVPTKEEGFEEIRYEWNKGSKCEEYLKAWILAKKQTTRIEDIKPSDWFKQQKAAYDRAVKEWNLKLAAYKAGIAKKDAAKRAKVAAKLKKEQQVKAAAVKKDLMKAQELKKKEAAEAKGEEYKAPEEKEEEKPAEEPEKEEEEEEEVPQVDLTTVDVFGVENVADIGNGMPLFIEFKPEDLTMMNLRFELSTLAHAFKKDSNDEDRTGIHVDHLAFYYQRYYNKTLNPKQFGVSSNEELCNLIIDSVHVADNIVESLLPEEFENHGLFMQLTEETRKHRNLLVESGDDSAKLKVSGGGGGHDGGGGGGGGGREGYGKGGGKGGWNSGGGKGGKGGDSSNDAEGSDWGGGGGGKGGGKWGKAAQMMEMMKGGGWGAAPYW